MTQIDRQEILILGGTGSLGTALTKKLLAGYKPKGIRIYSRDEFKQWNMRKIIPDINPNNIPVSFLIGDVRDKTRLSRACNGVDIIINCAAMKQVPACEENPIEAIQTNVNGAINIIDCAIDNCVEKVLHISTDKAVYPINLYGATKAVAEKLFIHANTYTGGHQTLFCCCRYGNVLGSRGSIIPLLREQSKTGVITITDADMTRFWITLDQVAKFILRALHDMTQPSIFIPRMPSMKIMDLAQVIAPDAEIRFIGAKKGEKIHECLIAHEEEISLPAENDRFVLHPLSTPALPTYTMTYFSNTNKDFLYKDQLKKIIEENNL